MASTDAARFGPIAAGLGVGFDPSKPERAAMACADRVEQLIDSLDVARSLDAVGVPHAALDGIAEAAVAEISSHDMASGPITTATIRSLLEGAYRVEP
jgi:alcohol dehydrogenase class IV